MPDVLLAWLQRAELDPGGRLGGSGQFAVPGPEVSIQSHLYSRLY
jgi:hypothetical protein